MNAEWLRNSETQQATSEITAKNRVLFTWLDIENHPLVDDLLRQLAVGEADTPVIAYGNEWLLKNPSIEELAERIGIAKPIQEALYDLVVVGAGPAGLAAAVYGASEGQWQCSSFTNFWVVKSSKIMTSIIKTHQRTSCPKSSRSVLSIFQSSRTTLVFDCPCSNR